MKIARRTFANNANYPFSDGLEFPNNLESYDGMRAILACLAIEAMLEYRRKAGRINFYEASICTPQFDK